MTVSGWHSGGKCFSGISLVRGRLRCSGTFHMPGFPIFNKQKSDSWSLVPRLRKADFFLHIGTWEAEAGGLCLQGQPELYETCLNKTKTKNKTNRDGEMAQ